MKKFYFFLAVIFVLSVYFIYHFYNDAFNQQIDFQRNLLKQQSSNFTKEIESRVQDFENEVLFYFPAKEVLTTLEDNRITVSFGKKIKQFLFKYEAFVQEIRFIGDEGAFLKAQKFENNYFPTEFSDTTILKSFAFEASYRDLFDGKFIFSSPIVLDGIVRGSIEVSVSLKNYVDNVMKFYLIENITWQCFITPDGIPVSTNFALSKKAPLNSKISKDVSEALEGSEIVVFAEKDRQFQLLVNYEPVSIFDKFYSILFILNPDTISEIISKRTIYTGSIIMVLLMAIIFLFMGFINKIRSSEKGLRGLNEELEGSLKLLNNEVKIRKDTEDKLKKEKALLSSLIDAIPDLVFYKDVNGVYLGCNPAFEKYAGKSAVEFVGLTDFDLFPEEDAKFFRKRDLMIFNEKKSLRNEEWITYPNGEKVLLETIKTPFKGETDEIYGLIGISRDITKRHEYELNLQNAKEQAESANMAKSIFLATMSHEIRTPLNSVLGFANLLQKEIDNPKLIDYIESIKGSSEVLLGIITNLLDLSKIEAGRMELENSESDLNGIFNSLSKTFSYKTEEKNVEFEINLQELKVSHVIIDELRLNQILTNLLSNAFKFTEKGSVSLIVESKDLMDGKCNLLFYIKDTGIGIPEDQQEIIFQPFHQMDGQSTRKFEGTGLGLTISQKLAKMMGGNISIVESSPNGTCFLLALNAIEYLEIKNQKLKSYSAENIEKKTYAKKMDCEITNHIGKAFPLNDFENSEAYKFWEIAKKSPFLDDIEKFANSLLQFHKNYPFYNLDEIAGMLLFHSKSFNVEKSKACLKTFGQFLEKHGLSTGI